MARVIVVDSPAGEYGTLTVDAPTATPSSAKIRDSHETRYTYCVYFDCFGWDTTMSDIATLVPEPADTELAASALRGLDAALRAQGPIRLRLSGQAGEVEMPRSALAALAQVLDSFAHGEGVTVVPAQAELTSQQAADALHVSRPFLIGLLDAGQIDYRTVGTHRRVKAASLIRYLREDDARRTAAADALATETRELGFA